MVLIYNALDMIFNTVYYFSFDLFPYFWHIPW